MAQNDPFFGPATAVELATHRPQAQRWRARWEPGQRIADFQRLFAFYIDRVDDPDFAIAKDPKAHERMMRDGQISGAIRLRQLATASRQIIFVPRHDDPPHRYYAEKTAQVWNKLRRPGEALLNILESIPRGLSVQEILWRLDDNLTLYPESMFPVDKSRFVFTLQRELALISPIDVFYGEALPPYTFLAHRFDPEPGPFGMPELESRVTFGRGLFDRLYPLFLWKTVCLRLAMRFAEQFASPYKIGRFPENNEEGRQAIEAALKGLEGALYASIPSGSEYDLSFEQPPTRGQVIYEHLLRYLDNQIVKIVLGSTLIMDSGGGESGSYTLGQSHERTTFGRVCQFDSQSLCDTIEQDLVRWIFTVNQWPIQYLPMVSQSSAEVGNTVEQVETLLTLADRGYPVSIEMISERTGIRTLRPGETPLAAVAPPMMMGGGQPNIDSGEGSFKPARDPFGRGDNPMTSGSPSRKGFSLGRNGKSGLGDIPDVYPE